jgi:hypothetical protein
MSALLVILFFSAPNPGKPDLSSVATQILSRVRHFGRINARRVNPNPNVTVTDHARPQPLWALRGAGGEHKSSYAGCAQCVLLIEQF